jgi:hypothetical protein
VRSGFFPFDLCAKRTSDKLTEAISLFFRHNRTTLSDSRTAIYTLINHMASQNMPQTGQREILNLDDIRPQILSKGYKASEFDETIKTYVDINVWQVLSGRRLKFI